MKKRILSGMRPTGRLHLGNYHGALKNWVDLQNEGSYDCFYFVADWHALTSDYNDTSQLKEYTFDMVVDWLSAGLDPGKSTLFIQSRVMDHAELFLLLSMITPLPWLERNPTYKEMRAELAEKDLSTFGSGLSRTSERRTSSCTRPYASPWGSTASPPGIDPGDRPPFNYLYQSVFPSPNRSPTRPQTPRLDGRKIASPQNAIYRPIREKRCSRKRLHVHDPQRMKRRTRETEICNVYAFHDLYTRGEVRNRGILPERLHRLRGL
jgi:tryptophanyl-tRNA synthetase